MEFVSIRVHSWLDCYHATRFACSLRCNARCLSNGVLRGTVTGTESCRFSHPAAAGSIDGNRESWLQQTPAHSRNRICKWRCLSLSRGSGRGISKSDIGRVKSGSTTSTSKAIMNLFRFDCRRSCPRNHTNRSKEMSREKSFASLRSFARKFFICVYSPASP